MFAWFCVRRNSKTPSKAFNAPRSRPISSGNADPERPSSGGKRHIKKPRTRILGTLNPSKLNHTDFLDMSNRASCNFRFKDSLGVVEIRNYDRFPKTAQGFFYYNAPPPHFPPIMGQLRFRITPNDDPSTFDSGSDLLASSEPFPWGFPLLHLASRTRYEHLCAQLVAEGLISRELLERCRLIWRNSLYRGLQPPPRLLYHLNQPFFFRSCLGSHVLSFWAVGKEKISPWALTHPFTYSRVAGIIGSGIFRLEKLDDGPYLGFRLMKTIERFVRRETPFRKHSIDEPVEGELVRRKGQVYKVDMNAEELSALRELPVISGES